ncbi:hypothetical protein [Marinobacter alkaliphilus]|uniref:hypothetical protein n=1 Tax=Marinobacter alkaliphilus TaxID=254719 RepID=UPI003D7668B5
MKMSRADQGFKSGDIEAISLVAIFQAFFLWKYLFLSSFLLPLVAGGLLVGLSEEKFSYLTLIKPAMVSQARPVEPLQASIMRLERDHIPDAIAALEGSRGEKLKVSVYGVGSDDLIALSTTVPRSGEVLVREVHETAVSGLISDHLKALQRVEERLNLQIEAVEQGIKETPGGSGGDAVLASLIERRSMLLERVQSLDEATVLTLARPGMEPEGLPKIIKFAVIVLASLLAAMILTLFVDFLARVRREMDAVDCNE